MLRGGPRQVDGAGQWETKLLGNDRNHRLWEAAKVTASLRSPLQVIDDAGGHCGVLLWLLSPADERAAHTTGCADVCEMHTRRDLVAVAQEEADDERGAPAVADERIDMIDLVSETGPLNKLLEEEGA